MTWIEVTLLNGTKVAITPPGGRGTAIGCGSGNWEFHPRFERERPHTG